MNRILTLLSLLCISVGCGRDFPAAAGAALTGPTRVSFEVNAPVGNEGPVSAVWNASRSTIDVTVDVLRGAAEASPNADFRISTDIRGGITASNTDLIADTKPISESGGTARVVQGIFYGGPGGNFEIQVTTQVMRGDSLIGDARTGIFEVIVTR